MQPGAVAFAHPQRCRARKKIPDVARARPRRQHTRNGELRHRDVAETGSLGKTQRRTGGMGRGGKGEGRGAAGTPFGRKSVDSCEDGETARMVPWMISPELGASTMCFVVPGLGSTRTEGSEPSSRGRLILETRGVHRGYEITNNNNKDNNITTTTTTLGEVCRLAFISSTTPEASSSASASGSISVSYPAKTEANV